MKKNEINSVAFISTYPPRQCGIATFTKDLSTAMNKKFYPKFKSKIIAMDNDLSKSFNYPDEVIFRINYAEIQDYVYVAEKINKDPTIKLVDIQHEYNIFSGSDGDYILHFLKKLEKPVVTTLHSVIDDPSFKRIEVTQEIINKSHAVVVFIDKAKEVLKNVYGIDNNVFVIPHGVHPVAFRHPSKIKTFFKTQDKIILSTFGLLGSKSKGLDYVIEALPQVIKKHPNVIYAILGISHPDVLRKIGGTYLDKLKVKIENLGLKNNVRFYNHFLNLKDLLHALQETDIYLTPYVGKDRKSSGTLAYALGCGRASISTPFYYAEDIIKNKENGLLIDFKDSKGFADAINFLLDNPEVRAKFEKRVYDQTRHMTWPNVAKNYNQIYDQICG